METIDPERNARPLPGGVRRATAPNYVVIKWRHRFFLHFYPFFSSKQCTEPNVLFFLGWWVEDIKRLERRRGNGWGVGWICREHEQTRSATYFQQPTGIQEINNIKNSKHRQKHSFCSFLLGLLAHLNGVFSTRHVTIITSSKVSWYKSNTQTEGYFHLPPSISCFHTKLEENITFGSWWKKDFTLVTRLWLIQWIRCWQRVGRRELEESDFVGVMTTDAE